jgi:ATP-dependent DNA ligase
MNILSGHAKILACYPHTYHNQPSVASGLRLDERTRLSVLFHTVISMKFSGSESSSRHADPFDDPHWLFELKHEGIRALAVVWRGHVAFLSETGRWLSAFPRLAGAIKKHLAVEEAILVGSIAAPDRAGRTALSRLADRPEEARFYAFDLIWLNGQDRRAVPLLSRKERLRELLPVQSDRLIFVAHVREYGTVLHRLACRRNFPGIIAKRADIAYDALSMKSGWVEIQNPRYWRVTEHVGSTWSPATKRATRRRRP